MGITKQSGIGPAINGTSASINLGSRTWTANFLYLIAVGQGKSATPTPATPTFSGNTGMTWDLVGTQTYNSIASPLGRISLFRSIPSATVTNTTVINNTNGNTVLGYYAIALSGMPTINNGANAIRQVAFNVSDSAADPNVTLDPLNLDQNSAVIGFFISNTTFGGTPESGWTSDADLAFSTVGLRAVHKIGGTDNTIVITRSGGTPWAGIGIEVINYRQFINIA